MSLCISESAIVSGGWFSLLSRGAVVRLPNKFSYYNGSHDIDHYSVGSTHEGTSSSSSSQIVLWCVRPAKWSLCSTKWCRSLSERFQVVRRSDDNVVAVCSGLIVIHNVKGCGVVSVRRLWSGVCETVVEWCLWDEIFCKKRRSEVIRGVTLWDHCARSNASGDVVLMRVKYSWCVFDIDKWCEWTPDVFLLIVIHWDISPECDWYPRVLRLWMSLRQLQIFQNRLDQHHQKRKLLLQNGNLLLVPWKVLFLQNFMLHEMRTHEMNPRSYWHIFPR